MLQSNDINYVKYAIYSLRMLSIDSQKSAENIHVSEEEKKIIQILAQILLTTDDNSIKFEIYWVLINLCLNGENDDMDNDKNIPHIISHFDIFCNDNLIGMLHKHTQSNYEDIFKNVMWFISHLVGVNVLFRDKILNSLIFSETVNKLTNGTLPYDQCLSLIWFASIIFKLKHTFPAEEYVMEALSIFANFIYSDEEEIINQCLWGIYYLSNFDSEILSINKDILSSGAVLKMMKLDLKKNHTCLVPTLRVLGNLCSGESEIIEVNMLFNYFFRNC